MEQVNAPTALKAALGALVVPIFDIKEDYENCMYINFRIISRSL